MTRLATSRRRRHFTRVIVAGALCAGVLSGCDSAPTDDRLSGVPLSESLRPAIDASRKSLRSGDNGNPQFREQVDRYHGLAAMLSSKDHRAAAEDSVYALWSREPGGILWPDLVAFHRHRVTDLGRLQALFDHPEFPDSTTALGAYLREWRRSGARPDGSGYEWARTRRSELTPFEDAWFGLRLSLFAYDQGRADESLTLALEALPAAREICGWNLEMKVWFQASLALQASGDLDDALHAAVMAEDLASAVAQRTGHQHRVLVARLRRAQVLAERREVEPALALYRSCAAEAHGAGLVEFERTVLNRAGVFTWAVGRYEEGLSFYQQALRGAIADQDSLNVPRHLANIGRRHRILGDLDSCRVYLEEAERWIRACPDPSNTARFPLMQAEFHAQVGNYAAVDSLHAVAEAMTPEFSRIAELAELHLELIRQGTERGRPAQVYRSIAFLDSLRDRLLISYADRNEVFDLDLAIAEFLGRQGLFAQADDTLDRAEAALARRPDPGRSWELSGARGHLARRRDDETATESFYRVCVSMSEQLGDDERLARSKLWLASHYLDQGEIDTSESILTSQTGGGFQKRFRTRVSVGLLRAMAANERDGFQEAQRELERVRSLCRPSSPPDLLARLNLETGRALAGLGRKDEAARVYARAREILANERSAIASEEDVFLDRDLRRELAEAILELADQRSTESGLGQDAEAALHEVAGLLPAWQRGDATAGPLAEPQIIFFVGDRASYRWSVRKESVTLQRLPRRVEMLQKLAPVLADLREPARGPVAAEITELTDALGGAPPRGTNGNPLVIVPDGPLFSVPWSAMAIPGGTPASWIDRGPIIVTDSPRIRASAPAAREAAGLRLLAVGVDASPQARSAGIGALRHAEREAREISSRWPEGHASLSVGDSADRNVFASEQLSQYHVIHISSHAQAYQGVADQTTLFLAGATDAPVTAAEIRKIDLQAELVFLSCCETIRGVRRGVGPAHVGLARSFLDAGARNVIASGIRVDDEAARHFAVRFYEHWLKGVRIEDALRMAQLDLRDGDSRWAHPYYWAFYQMITPPLPRVRPR